MSTSDFLFQNQAPSVWTSPSYSNTSTPDWWQAASQGLISRASQIAGQGYQPYNAPRIAGFSPLSENAMQLADKYAPDIKNMFTGATERVIDGGVMFDKNKFNSFLSPYTEGVVDRIAQLGQRNLSENLLPAVNDTFIKAGQFGGSRNADFTLRALRDTNESILGQQASALEGAHKNAMSSYQDAAGRRLDAGKTMGALGSFMGDEYRKELENMNKFGLQAQGQQQSNLDLARSDFENQVNFPNKQLELLNSIIRGYAPQGNSTTVSYGSSPSYGTTSPLTNIAALLQSWGGGQAS